jgi:hypothetical protein
MVQLIDRIPERTNLSGADAAVLNRVIDTVNALVEMGGHDADELTDTAQRSFDERHRDAVAVAPTPTATPTNADVERMINDRLAAMLERFGVPRDRIDSTFADRTPGVVDDRAGVGPDDPFRPQSSGNQPSNEPPPAEGAPNPTPPVEPGPQPTPANAAP